MKQSHVYFENFTLTSLLIGLLKQKDIRMVFSGFNAYYFDSSFFANKVLIPILIKCNYKINRLHFNMVDINSIQI